MKPFNLAEAKIAERNYCRQHLQRRLNMAAMLVILTIIIAAASCAGKIFVQQRAIVVKSRLADVQSKCISIKRQYAVIESKANQRKWQVQLSDGSKQWLGVLNSIMFRVPSNVWLKSVQSTPESSSLNVEGHSSDYSSLSDFITKLRCVSAFSDVQMSNSKVTRTEKSAFIDFSLVIKLKHGEKQPAANANQVPRVTESK